MATKKAPATTSKQALVKKYINKGMTPKQANAFATQALKRSSGKKKGS